MLNSTRRGSLILGMNDLWVDIEWMYLSEAKSYIGNLLSHVAYSFASRLHLALSNATSILHRDLSYI